jgi:transcriptional regulator with XRE-family HTH domain
MADHVSTLGALLRDARERLARRNGARVRQADIAEHADITVEWYARIERGSVIPSLDVLSRIATALYLSSQERLEVLRFAVPDLMRHDDIGPAPEPAGRATRELRALRRFQHRAEAASSPHELIDMAATAVMDGLPDVTFAGVMLKSVTHGCWRHRSAVRPDLAAAVNASPPLDDRSIHKATYEQDGLRFVGSSDYGASWSTHLRERDQRTELRSGFGVRIPMSESFLGYCRTEPSAPNTEHILFLGGIGSILALTMRGARLTPDDIPTIRRESAPP